MDNISSNNNNYTSSDNNSNKIINGSSNKIDYSNRNSKTNINSKNNINNNINNNNINNSWLKDKVVVVTGSTSGIGWATCKMLYKKGCHVIMACRNLEKGERLMESERMLEGDKEESERRCQVMHLDLASMKSVRKFAEGIAKRHGTINVLINNAGVLTGVKADTEDGHEIHFGVNYLGHFYLTYLLLPTLMTSFPARVINVASHVESFPVDFNELNCRKSYLNAYGRSKACNIMFTVHLAKLLKNTHVKTCSLHPGYVATNLAADVQDTCLLRSIKCYMACTCKKLVKPDEGAMVTMMCCEMADEEMENGGFYRDSMLSKPPKHCRDAMRCEKLWKVSCEMCHLPEDLRLHLLQK